MPDVSFDPRAVTIDGKRTLLLSGAIHYPRSTPAMWPQLMRRSREAGLNTIETYVFWNLHERRRGVLDFSDRLDLRRFVELAANEGLRVILRIGPYICAETNYGGFPAWLRDVPGIRIRTDNEPFKREKERWVRLLCDYVRGFGGFAPQGGPIIAAQIENEYDNVAKNYGDAAPRYLDWCCRLAHDLNLGIPWIMCLAHGGAGAVDGTIATINGFYGHQRLDQHFREHAGQPALWTENWPGWYDIWGRPHHLRDPHDVAYAAARFIAAGGTGVNYYMWHGGTNFDRESMYLQTTSYDFDAPLDEYGLTTTKSNHLAALHRCLADHAADILDRDPASPAPLGEHATAYTYGPLTFLCNDSRDRDVTVNHGGFKTRLPAWSVSLIREGKVLFNTRSIARRHEVTPRMAPISRGLGAWSCWREPMPLDAPDASIVSVAAKKPVEQLQLTEDQSDYCWYTAVIAGGARSATGTLALKGVADFVSVFLDGRRVAGDVEPPAEDRGRFSADAWTRSFELAVPPGKRVLSILCAAVGLIKGDWQLGGQNMALERKGLFDEATWNGRPIRDWIHTPALFGERAALPDGGDRLIQWSTAARGRRRPLTWWRCELPTPAGDDPVALDLTGMTKGLVWLNGRGAGRYWLADGHGTGVAQWQAQALRDDTAKGPTQRYYHLPRDWFAPPHRPNTLLLFEECGGSPEQVRLVKRSLVRR